MFAYQGARFILNARPYVITKVTRVNVEYHTEDTSVEMRQYFKAKRTAFASMSDAGLIVRNDKCPACGDSVDKLAEFPGGLDLKCYANTPAARRVHTADEITAMWRG